MKNSASLTLFIIFLATLFLASCQGDKNKDDKKTTDISTDTSSSTATDVADTNSEVSSDLGTDTEDVVDTEDEDEDDDEEDEDEEESTDAAASEETSQIQALIADLKNRRHAMALNERELIRREQRLANLEINTIKRSSELAKTKEETRRLLEVLKEKAKDAVAKDGAQKEADDKAQKEADEKTALQKAKDQEIEKLDAKALAQAASQMNEKRKERIQHLTSTIKGMRPATGAGLLSSMNEDDSVAILRGLGARQAAALLGAMPPDKAAKLAEAMLGPRAPEPGIFDKKKPDEE